MINQGRYDFEKMKQHLENKGWRIIWHTERQSHVCYKPDGSECFAYGTEENEIHAAWAYLVHTLELDRRPPEYWIEDKGEDA